MFKEPLSQRLFLLIIAICLITSGCGTQSGPKQDPQAKVEAGFEQLREGMTRLQVRELIGPPTANREATKILSGFQDKLKAKGMKWETTNPRRFFKMSPTEAAMDPSKHVMGIYEENGETRAEIQADPSIMVQAHTLLETSCYGPYGDSPERETDSLVVLVSWDKGKLALASRTAKKDAAPVADGTSKK